jgi:hypothetical protein
MVVKRRSLVYSKLYEARIKTGKIGCLTQIVLEKFGYLMVELANVLNNQLQLDAHIF